MADKHFYPWEHYTSWLEQLGVPTNVVTASLTLLVGLLLALIARRLARALVRRGGRVVAGLSPGDSEPSTRRVETTLGSIVYWGVLLFFVMAATETLGLPVVTGWLAQVANYVPRIVATILIVALGTLAARLTRELVARAASSANAPGAERLARAAQVALLIATGLVAIEQLGIEVSFLKAALLVLLAAMLGGAALAFGLGGRLLVANVLSAHYVQKTYQVGQTIRFRDVEGRIVRINEFAVIVAMADGEVVIPAGQLTEHCSTLVLKAGAK
jgi:hypothetical protein